MTQLQQAIQDAKRFNTKTDFQKKARKSWELLLKDPHIYQQATSHMSNPLKKWDKEAILSEAKKYTKPWHFQLKSKGAYWVAQQNGWLNEACAHMESSFSWDLITATNEAKKYQTRKEFRKNARGAYNFLARNSKQSLDNACAHMEKRFVWNNTSAISEAKKYQTRKELRQNNDGCYAYIVKNKLSNQAFKHMASIIDHAEKKDQAVFEQKLRDLLVKNKIKFVLLKEFNVGSGKNHRVDLLLNLIPLDLKIAIEYKADSSSWNKKEIEKQRQFYQTYLKKIKVKETFLISKTGVYGWSDEQFLNVLKKIIKTKKIIKYTCEK